MKKLFPKIAFALITALILSMSCFCLPAISATPTVRGIWVASVGNIDFPSKQGLSEKQLKTELDEIVDTCVKNGVNTVFFQVRPNADALYASSVFPWSKVLSGTQGIAPDSGFDPLEYMVSACHKNSIALHAWINPYRVCKVSELDTLSDKSPAKTHPEYTVTCSDGGVYFNPALKAVQDLITSGVTEILENYDVDGIHFDDYFYPYGVTDYPDAEDFKKYGADFSDIGDFRRDNVNTLVKRVYQQVHKYNAVFGISPFGIWDNKSSNKSGSDTNGMSAYSAIFADSKKWVEEGWVDYICPQVYWSFENTAAPFETVTRWWDALCKDSGVDLYIGHALYKLGTDEKGWEDSSQIRRQLDLCEKLDNVSGNVFFRYKTLEDDVLGCTDAITQKDVATPAIPKAPDTPAVQTVDLTVTSPANGYITTAANCSVSGFTDPSLPLTVNGEPVTLTKNGYFSVYLPLSVGNNAFTFSNGDQSRTVSVRRNIPSTYVPDDIFVEGSAFPVGGCTFSPSENVTVSVRGKPNTQVFVSAAGNDIQLAETPLSDTQSLYSTTVTMPDSFFSDVAYGTLTFYALIGAEKTLYPDTADITVSHMSKTLYVPEECYVYDSVFGGSMMDNYQLSKGSAVIATAFANGSYRLLSGKWISKDNVTVKKTDSALDIDTENYQKITVTATAAFESYAQVTDSGVLLVDLYGAPSFDVTPSDDVTTRLLQNGNNTTAVIKLGSLPVTGFFIKRVSETTLEIFVYSEGGGIVGKTIAIDPGHGGIDPGALGPVGEHGSTEDDLNLSMSLLLADKLAKKGAKIVLTRTTDKTLLLDERSGLIRENYPDISVSVHHNSVAQTSDFNKAEGALILYSRETGLPLANAVASALNAPCRAQSLNVCRDYRYPCILIECGYVCNPAEYEKLLTDEYKNELCDKIVSAICDYFDKNS